MSKPNTGIAFTGGGSRSYQASVGYLAALHELGLMDKVRYVSGISGGNWATLGYTYAQNKVDDSVLLGPVVSPADLTRDGLNVMHDDCMRAVTESDYVTKMLGRMLGGVDAGEAWMQTYQEVYLDPLNIPSNVPFSWNKKTVDSIKLLNPSLQSTTFTLPANSKRPYSIVGVTNLGPAAGAPYKYGDNLNLTMLEITPLYVGSMGARSVDYHYHLGLKHSITVGGAVEPFAYSLYDSDAVPREGLNGNTEGYQQVPAFDKPLDLAHAGGASSYAIGMFMDSLPEKLRTNMDYSMMYWSPADKKPKSQETLFADGGCLENILVSSMLQRRVQRIVLFFNSNTPLQPASSWDVYKDDYTGKQVTDELAAYFGVYPVGDPSFWQVRGYDYSRNQQWRTEDWFTLITQLQEAQARGNGIITTMNLTTVGNTLWNVPAGITTQVTFVCLGRALSWEAQLSAEMRALLVPADAAEAADPSKTVSSGPFKSFPHYATAGASINNEKANALADLTGWTVKRNADLFRSILA